MAKTIKTEAAKIDPEKKADTVEIDTKEVIAKAHKIYPKLESFKNFLGDFAKEFSDLRFTVITLINERESLRAENNRLTIEKSKIEQEAQLRLGNIQRGNKDMVDRLSKREIELANKVRDNEIREAQLSKDKQEVELLRAEYQRRLEVAKA